MSAADRYACPQCSEIHERVCARIAAGRIAALEAELAEARLLIGLPSDASRESFLEGIRQVNYNLDRRQEWLDEVRTMVKAERTAHERTKAERDRHAGAARHHDQQAQAAYVERDAARRELGEAWKQRDAVQAELTESYTIARMREIEILAERDATQVGAAAMRQALEWALGHDECLRDEYGGDPSEDGDSPMAAAMRAALAGNAGRDLAARVPLWRALERLVRGGCTPLNERVGKLLFDLAALDEKGGNE